MICLKCGKDVTTALMGNVCFDCYHQDTVRVSNQYTYRCPDCHGEFMFPHMVCLLGRGLVAQCPWCARIMFGMGDKQSESRP